MGTYRYQIALLGKPWLELSTLTVPLLKATADLGIAADAVHFLGEADLAARDRKSPLVALFFGYVGATVDNHAYLSEIHDDSWPIIPVVQDVKEFRSKVPEILEPVNGFELTSQDDIDRLVSLILENLRLLRSERRLFISYRRVESTAVAIQLFEALDQKGFKVFLDTRSVRPALNFQAELWHSLADSDIVVLLDTPGFRKSEWTTKELTQANVTSIQTLHLLWPGVAPDNTSAFSDFYPLDEGSFHDQGQPHRLSKLTVSCVEDICNRAESLRARAFAARYTYLVDQFCDIARSNGHDVAVHPERYMSLERAGKLIAVFPAVGIPTSLRLQTFEAAVKHLDPLPVVKVIYDERGILDQWRMHLDWLNGHLPTKALQMTSLNDEFASGL